MQISEICFRNPLSVFGYLVTFECSPVGVFREATTDFTVDARALTKTGGNHIKTCINNPSGNRTEALIRDLGDGTYQVEYTPYEEGEC